MFQIFSPFTSRREINRFLCLGLILILGAGCVGYHPKPITAARQLTDFEKRALDAPELKRFLQATRESGEWPPAAWDLKSLTLVSFYYHPDLDVARAQWGVAQAGRITAGEWPNPTVNLLLGYNSTTPTAEVTPWIPEAVLDIPIDIAGKRGYRISQARHLAESARLNILSVAWEVRSRLRQVFLDFYAAQETESLLYKQQSLQMESVRILEAQLAAGEASPADVTQARIALNHSRLAALEAAAQKAQVRVQLAGALGLPTRALDGVALAFDSLVQIHPDLPSNEIRCRALVGRADIRAALSEYEASQAALQLEIAKQYPDINLGPGYQLDQTDSKWTLGLSLILPLFNRNRGPIAEAEARRTETASRFLALQAKVIGEIEGAVAACRSAAERFATAAQLLTNLKKQETAASVRYEAGEISKLELLGVQLELAASALARSDALVKAQQAVGELENAMQSPLDLKEWVLQSPGRSSGQTKERKNE